jgi:predicted dehydrogenase
MEKRQQLKTSRRSFLKGSAAAATGVTLGAPAMGAPAFQRKLGANDRIRTGFIGVGNRGTQLLHGFMEEADVDVAALCDVYKPFLERDDSKVDKEYLQSLGGYLRKMGEKFEHPVDKYEDFRRLLERKDIDAVVIATPDHWHAIQAIMACNAGKDVYVEKPLSQTVVEGRKMVEAAKRNNSIVQVGLHRRSSDSYKKVAELIQGGKVGKVTVVRGYRISNMFPSGIGEYAVSNPPPGLDWDMWLGPRAKQPYQGNIAPYKFRWWGPYSSQVANWGVHLFDAIRWALGEQAPACLSAHGGRFAVKDDRTIPDTLETIFEFDSGPLLCWGQYEASGGSALLSGEIEFRGTLGNLYSSGSGYRIVPSRGGQFQKSEPRLEAEEERMPRRSRDLAGLHIRNFLDCVKSRKPWATDRIRLPFWRISRWRSRRVWSGIQTTRWSRTTRKLTSSCITSTERLGS